MPTTPPTVIELLVQSYKQRLSPGEILAAIRKHYPDITQAHINEALRQREIERHKNLGQENRHRT
jgi:uncharacterized protein (DUF433 family)